MGELKYKVLVADDDDILRTLAADMLCEKYEVTQACDGLEAWNKAREIKPALVVTDLMMPGMHGYELCELLKGPGGVPGVKIIVTSSKSFSVDKLQAKKAGADLYLVKPFLPSELLSAAEKLLSGAEERGEGGKKSIFDKISASEASVSSPAAASTGAGAKPVKVRFWGTRGSCPCPGPGTVRYGGNTACIEVRAGDTLIILECGTGLRGMGASLVKEFGSRPMEGHIFLSHSHWDHIQGFPFFVPLYNPKNSFKIYGLHAAHGSLKNVFSGSMAEDYFPVLLSDMGGKLDFVEMAGPQDAGEAKVKYRHLNHPGLCIGFRMETHGKTITYIADHECFARLSGENQESMRQDAEILDFARGSDLIIREAQYTEDEYSKKKGWGHSTFDDVVKFGIAAGTRKLVLFHHDPEHTDEIMDEKVVYCKKLVSLAGSEMECEAAAEGMALEL